MRGYTYRFINYGHVSVFYDGVGSCVMFFAICVIFRHGNDSHTHVTSNPERDEKSNAAKYRHQVALRDTSAAGT
jgi:hypothetical protein